MILIISEENDITTNYVIDWVINKEKEFEVLNSILFTDLTQNFHD